MADLAETTGVVAAQDDAGSERDALLQRHKRELKDLRGAFSFGV